VTWPLPRSTCAPTDGGVAPALLCSEAGLARSDGELAFPALLKHHRHIQPLTEKPAGLNALVFRGMKALTRQQAGRSPRVPSPGRRFRGTSNQNVEPAAGSLEHSSLPPIDSTSRRQTARPSPLPPCRRVDESSACTKGLNRAADV